MASRLSAKRARVLYPLLFLVGIVLVGTASPAPTLAQPVGTEFQVNTYTTGYQGYPGAGLSVARDADGDFIVVWGGQGQGQESGVFGRRYDSTGTAQGDQFQVNTYTTGYQGFGVAVASDADGDFVVAWTESGQGDYYGIFGQRFSSAGAPEGGEFRVNTYTTGAQGWYGGVAIAAASGGDFVIVWKGAGAGDYTGVFGQRYDSAGVAQGGEFRVNTYTTGSQGWYGGVAIAAASGGDFVIVWNGAGAGDYTGVFGQRFDSTGVAQGGQFQVNTYTTGSQGEDGGVAVASDADGDFVVVWSQRGQGDDDGVFGQRFSSSGGAQGSEFLVNTYTTDAQGYLGPAVAAAPDGSFIVAWSGAGPDDYTGIFARRYDGAGVAQGDAFQVNTYTTHEQGPTSIAADAAGNFVVVWSSYPTQTDPYLGVVGQRFSSAGVAQGSEFQVNTYTTGFQGTKVSVAADAAGGFVVVWDGYAPEPSYFDIFGRLFDEAFLCPAEPRADCRQQTNRRRGAFRFRDPATPKRRSLAWRAPTLEATAFADFGDPFTDTHYVLCVYDESPEAQPVIQARMPAGGICNVIPCWTELAPPGKTIRYFDSLRDPDGINMMKLRAGEEGKARTGLRGRGENLDLPQDALTPPVIVQLQASNGLCFTARYEDRIRKNEAGKFVGRPGSPSGAFLDASAAALD